MYGKQIQAVIDKIPFLRTSFKGISTFESLPIVIIHISFHA